MRPEAGDHEGTGSEDPRAKAESACAAGPGTQAGDSASGSADAASGSSGDARSAEVIAEASCARRTIEEA